MIRHFIFANISLIITFGEKIFCEMMRIALKSIINQQSQNHQKIEVRPFNPWPAIYIIYSNLEKKSNSPNEI